MGGIHRDKYFVVVESDDAQEFAWLVEEAESLGYVLAPGDSLLFTGERYVAFYLASETAKPVERPQSFMVIVEESPKLFASRVVQAEEDGFAPVAGRSIYATNGWFVAFYVKPVVVPESVVSGAGEMVSSEMSFVMAHGVDGLEGDDLRAYA
jgi:hypothetical protein